MVITREHVHYYAACAWLKERLGAARLRRGPLRPVSYSLIVSADKTTTENVPLVTRIRYG